MDSEERIEAATAIWNGEGPAAAAAPSSGAPADGAAKAPEAGAAAAPAAAPAQEQKPAEGAEAKSADPAKPAEPAKPEASPEVQQLTQELEAFKGVMAEAKVESVEQLKATVQDAMILYSVLDGQQKPRQLLEAVRTTQRPEVFQTMCADLKAYLTELEGGAPAAAAKGQDDKGGTPTDPLAQRVQTLEEQNAARAAQAEQQRVHQERLKVIDKFEAHVKTLAEKEGLSADDIALYSDWVSKKIGADKEAVKRLEAGKMNDVEKFFTECHNIQIQRFKRWNESLLAKKTDKQNNTPRIPAGGSPPAPAEPAKAPAASGAEERIKRATELFRGATIQ